MELEELSAAISAIYDCALDPSLWSGTLDRLNHLFGSAYSAVFLVQNEPFVPLAYFHSKWDETEARRLVYEFGPSIPGVLETITGPIGLPVSLLSRLNQDGVNQHLQSRFYKEWVEPQGLHDAVLTKFCGTRNRSGTFQLTGWRDWNIDSGELNRLIELLLPHLSRAAMISDMIERSFLELENLQNTVNLMAAPIILIKSDRKICYANKSAERFLETGQILRELNGILTIWDITTRRAFERALAAASYGDNAIGTQGVGIPLNSGDGYPAVCYVLPINNTKARAAQSEATVALFISTLAHALPIPASVMATVFSLTSAEARLACELQSDESIAEVSARLGISENSAKTHLKNLYAKTETSRRSELHELVLSLSPIAN